MAVVRRSSRRTLHYDALSQETADDDTDRLRCRSGSGPIAAVDRIQSGCRRPGPRPFTGLRTVGSQVGYTDPKIKTNRSPPARGTVLAVPAKAASAVERLDAVQAGKGRLLHEVVDVNLGLACEEPVERLEVPVEQRVAGHDISSAPARACLGRRPASGG
jgi:hypothetical protein